MLINIYNSKWDYSNKSNLKLKKIKSRVIIHSTIQIQLTLFKFVALFKILGTIQIRNMNSKIPLAKWMSHFRGFCLE